MFDRSKWMKEHPTVGRRFKKGMIPWNKDKVVLLNDVFIKNNPMKNPLIARKVSESLKRLYKEGKKPITTIFKKGCSSLMKGKHHTEEAKEKNRKWHKLRWEDKEFRNKMIEKLMKSQSIRPTKPEQTLIDLLQQKNLPFDYTGNGKVIIEGFNPDFMANNGSKKIIEVYGNYWHNRKDVIEKDKRKMKLYKKQGFDVLVLWDYELKNNQFMDKINNFMGNNNAI